MFDMPFAAASATPMASEVQFHWPIMAGRPYVMGAVAVLRSCEKCMSCLAGRRSSLELQSGADSFA